MIKHEVLVYNQTKTKVPGKFIKDTLLEVFNFLKLKQPVELAVLIVNTSEIKRLNKYWRGKNEAVDELSFGLNSHLPVGMTKFAKNKNKVLELGEVVVNGEKTADKNYLKTILAHSLLHLLGYNHEKSAIQAKKMKRLENKILKFLNLNIKY